MNLSKLIQVGNRGRLQDEIPDIPSDEKHRTGAGKLVGSVRWKKKICGHLKRGQEICRNIPGK